MAKIKVCVLRTAGTNCDKETAFAFAKVGACPELVHINNLVSRKNSLNEYSILVFPGGFSYGDDVAAGKILANELRCKLTRGLEDFVAEGKLIIGICNGFQVLVKAGLLPGNKELKQEVTLSVNDSAKFEDRWVYLRLKVKGQRLKCVWVKNFPEIIYLPVAHGEGKFITKGKVVLNRLKKNNQIVFQYCGPDGKDAGYPYNPNGSIEDIAGICDETGRILGLMPHPERHISFQQHPERQKNRNSSDGDGLTIFRNGVEYARRHL